MFFVEKYLMLSAIIFLTGCDIPSRGMVFPQDKENNLQFNCTGENVYLPALDPQADNWFKQARVLEKAKRPKDYAAIGALYRQAVDQGHYKAMRNLQNLLSQGLVKPLPGKRPSEEALEIVEKMIKMNIPSGYYAMGYYLENGYGVEPDKMASLAYYRKAADLGNPEGQYVIGRIFLSKNLGNDQKNLVYRPEIGKAMLICSANNGYGPAAYELANHYKLIDKNYKMATYYYQLGVRNGDYYSALNLQNSFQSPPPTDMIHYLNVTRDDERVHRYLLIKHEIGKNSSARFPDLDKIVPLPPAPLPKWDGSFEYKKGGK
ncbi:sel1 repeat family protein [Rahnella sp. SAP-1]|uniref:Sel1 repeat family protein n=2 Tax=Rouxiella aceris TaxID=2703884 RepID=A0A848MIP1_9GAMM|nr:sel1 repeat family protein [Rouxiella aceris]